jgi:4-amino-4-deoxy-L-arabinose transferase-like glycosyltransferase
LPPADQDSSNQRAQAAGAYSYSSAHKRLLTLLSVCLLLLIYTAVRLHHLMALPLFIDESFHIETAQRAADGHWLESAGHGRFFRVWYNAILGVDTASAGWVTRAGTVVIGLLGVAAFYGLVRAMASHRAGLIAVIIWTLAPYLVFYERMALADPLLSSLSVVAVWLAWRLARQPARRWAILLGLMLPLLILAKASGIVWLPLPAVTLLLIPGWRERVRLGALAYGTAALTGGLPLAALRLRGYNYFGLASVFTQQSTTHLSDRLWNNARSIWTSDVAYLGLPVVLLAVAGGLYWLWQRPRPALWALAIWGMGAGGTLVFGRLVNSRYALNQVAWVLLPLAVGIGLVIKRWPRGQPVIYAAVGIGLAAAYGPFLLTAWNDAADLPLTTSDQGEYIKYDSSGYGVTEIGAQLRQMDEPLPTLGLVANCQTLRVAAYPVSVTCPVISWDGANQRQLMKQAEDWAARGPVYVVGEDLSYLDLTGLPQPFTVVTIVERPGSRWPVRLYRLEQGARRPD